ncbi:hypothetical protein [Streptomyces atratus]|uniref:hypothetical protein n=1 Tax=Streptomyces atratus TaxID=1893 RepID=UPI00365F1C75
MLLAEPALDSFQGLDLLSEGDWGCGCVFSFGYEVSELVHNLGAAVRAGPADARFGRLC